MAVSHTGRVSCGWTVCLGFVIQRPSAIQKLPDDARLTDESLGAGAVVLEGRSQLLASFAVEVPCSTGPLVQ